MHRFTLPIRAWNPQSSSIRQGFPADGVADDRPAYHGREGFTAGPINPIDVHNHINEVLLKILRRNISSIPTDNTPEHTIMKRQTILSIVFSV
ncbi:MAG: hypothetical protein ACRESJ_22675, partial [Pseudomonas sp.]|uniref:hypothetical protein n=1 Tax=Pseudomonas sp. TaxID=306 RepID=UPI003D6F8209